jgi:predicted PurR-regulated permease PerM
MRAKLEKASGFVHSPRIRIGRPRGNSTHLCLLDAVTPRTVSAMNPPELPPLPEKEVGGLLRFPTPWQRKTMWTALATVAVATMLAIAVGFIYIFSQVMAYLQPILVPFAIAGVLAYLLEPLVARLVRFGTTRRRAVVAVFVVTSLAFVGVMFWIVPTVSAQSAKLARKVPEMTRQVRHGIASFALEMREKYGLRVIPDELYEITKPPPEIAPEPKPSAPEGAKPATSGAAEKPAPAPGATVESSAEKEGKPPAPVRGTPNPEEVIRNISTGEWVNKALPRVFESVWGFFNSSLGGFLGLFGFLLSLIIVPLYLFYILAEYQHIAASWTKYVPLRASEFKDEVVACLVEVNSYLIAFFRGQLVVSTINGVATGIFLTIVGLDFGFLIGLGLCFLGIIPYIGITLCWIPAVIIASVQGGSWLVPASAAWWVFPLVVTGVFAVVQQVDGLFVTPRIVGERVGLHPVTVIFSVFLWSLLLGGLLGAILAVPLTAASKVLLKRYVWERNIVMPAPENPPVAETLPNS